MSLASDTVALSTSARKCNMYAAIASSTLVWIKEREREAIHFKRRFLFI